MNQTVRQANESLFAYSLRITQLLNQHKLSLKEWAQCVVGPTSYGDETLRRVAKVFQLFLEKAQEDKMVELSDKELSKFLLTQKQEAQIERRKIQTENLQLQENYRSLARSELLFEQIQTGIKDLEPIEVKEFSFTKPTERTALLLLADQHFDSNFEVKGLFGEVVNIYNKDIFYTRMWSLLAKMDADKFDYDKLTVVCMGDCVEGLLRMTSLQKLRQPVVKSIIQFAEFMSQWLKEVSNRLGVPVSFAMVGGNHGVARFLSQKPEFKEENLEYIIHAFIKVRLENEKNITVEPYDDIYFTNFYGLNCLFAHGENNDLESLVHYCENLYDVTIDRCYGAHYHAESSKSFGVANLGSKMIIRVPSLCGTDTYAKSIQKHNRAGCYFALFDEDGEVFNKIYYLN